MNGISVDRRRPPHALTAHPAVPAVYLLSSILLILLSVLNLFKCKQVIDLIEYFTLQVFKDLR